MGAVGVGGSISVWTVGAQPTTSYNDGAGMDHYERIVGFVRRNMPRGVDPLHPQLTLQQAWDVSAYVIAQPRPHYQAR